MLGAVCSIVPLPFLVPSILIDLDPIAVVHRYLGELVVRAGSDTLLNKSDVSMIRANSVQYALAARPEEQLEATGLRIILAFAA